MKIEITQDNSADISVQFCPEVLKLSSNELADFLEAAVDALNRHRHSLNSTNAELEFSDTIPFQ